MSSESFDVPNLEELRDLLNQVDGELVVYHFAGTHGLSILYLIRQRVRLELEGRVPRTELSHVFSRKEVGLALEMAIKFVEESLARKELGKELQDEVWRKILKKLGDHEEGDG